MRKFSKLCFLLVAICVLVFNKPHYAHGNCNLPCNLAVDIVLVLDESGSISANAFQQLRQFSLQFAGLFTISPTNANIGVVLFGNTARIVLPLSSSAAAVQNSLATMQQQGGLTNTQDGLLKARSLLAASPRAATAPQIILIITDGNANVPPPAPNAINLAIQQATSFKQSSLHTLIGVGVGNDIDQNFITTISSPNAAFQVSQFGDLSGLITKIINAACYRAPELKFPPDVYVPCTAKTDPASIGFPTVTGWCQGCSPNPPTYKDVITPGKCPQEKLITRTWTVTDKCGKKVTGIQRIHVQDTVPPTLTVPASKTLECPANTSVEALGKANATDNCDPRPVVTYKDVRTNGSCTNEYTIVRTFTAKDACGNSKSASQIIQVVDNTPPKITKINHFCLWPPNHKYYCISNLTRSKVVEATDSCSKNTYILFQGCVSNQPDNSKGDGNTIRDCYYNTTSDQLCFRAERAGNPHDNRVYSAYLAIVDYLNVACQNIAQAVLNVTVPHDQSDPAFRNCQSAN